MAKRKQRTDTITAQVEAFKISVEEIKPPAHVKLRDTDKPFWDSIVRARARSTWNDSDLENAANLARCKSDIERLQAEIIAEGDVIENQRGTPIVNPKHTLLETLSRRAMALSRMLHVHAEATVGESRDQAKRKGVEDSAAAIVKDMDDGLIAAPMQH
jgi:hypothetical protein